MNNVATLDLGMDTFSDWMTNRGLSATTVSKRSNFYRGRLTDWGTLDVPVSVIAEWLSRYDGWSRCTYHAHLTAIYDWMVDTGRRRDNPARSIRRPPTPRPSPRPISADELRHALASAAPRTRSFLMLGAFAGLRAHEIAKIQGQDIDQARVRVLGKGAVDATVPTHPLLWQVAQRYPRAGYWFPSTKDGRQHIVAATVTRDVTTLFRSLGMPGSTHRARHTFGTTLVRNGANLRIVQDLMRHLSLATTALYLGVDEDERRAAIRSLAA